MLQPRLSSVCGSARMRNFGGFRGMAALLWSALILSATLVSCQGKPFYQHLHNKKLFKDPNHEWHCVVFFW